MTEAQNVETSSAATESKTTETSSEQEVPVVVEGPDREIETAPVADESGEQEEPKTDGE